MVVNRLNQTINATTPLINNITQNVVNVTKEVIKKADVKAIVLIGMILLIPITLFLLWWFRKSIKRTAMKIWKRNIYIEAHFFNANKQIESMPITYDVVTNTFKYGEESYNVQQDTIVYNNSIPHEYYIKGCPFPLKFEMDKDLGAVFTIDSHGLKTLLDNKLLEELLKKDNADKWGMISTIASGVTLVALIVVANMIMKKLAEIIALISIPGVK
jgi:hypothetical protein